ncbi:MAG TPA: hypothetical protein VLA52_16320 [Thermohalobaculum sp.]|nr:hypothetical protein [Thermohalobaculum sp.]
MTDRVVHFLLHVPRCAGTTVEAHFQAALGPGLLHAPRWHNPLRAFLGELRALDPADPRLTAVRIVTGHSMGARLKRHFPGTEIRESVLLRDPLGFHVSLYNHRVASHRTGSGPAPPEFARWYAMQRRNPVSRFLLNHYYDQRIPALYRLSSAARLSFLEARLRDFWFVADYRHADEMIAGISREMGIAEHAGRKNVTAAPALTPESLDPTMRARIVAENSVDQALWERWKDRGWRAEAHDPQAPSPALPGNNALGYLASDLATFLRRSLRL